MRMANKKRRGSRVKPMLEKYRKSDRMAAQDGTEEVPAVEPPPVEETPPATPPEPSDLGGGMAAGVAEQIRQRHEAMGNLNTGTSKIKKKKMGGLRGC